MESGKLRLDGKTILLIEDDFLVGLDLKQMLEGAGATVIGPVGNPDEGAAIARAELIHGGILDVNLRGQTSGPVGHELLARRISFVVVTGYARETVPGVLKAARHLQKPIEHALLLRMATTLFV